MICKYEIILQSYEGSMNDISEGIMYKSEGISCRIIQE